MKHARIYLPIAVVALSLSLRAAAAEWPAFTDGESALIAPEEVKSALRAYDSWLTNEVYRLSTDAAVRAIDEVFAKDDDYSPETRRRRLKRLLSDGMGVMYAYDTVSNGRGGKVEMYHNLLLLHLMPEAALPSREVYSPDICYDRAFWQYGKLEDLSVYASSVRTLFRPLLGAVRRFEAAESRAESVAREVVADVETVRLLSLTHLDASAFPGIGDEDRYDVVDVDENGEETCRTPPESRANYLVTLRVRQGETGFKRFSFPVVFGPQPLTREGAWLFYRGITLAVGFASSNGVERVARIDPVLPYPPYTKEGIRVYDREGASDMEDMGEAFAGVASGDSRLDQERALCLNYGDHTFVQFTSGTNAVEGMCGSYPELGSSVRIEVWTDGPGSDPDYWRDAWFSYNRDDESWESSSVRVKPALECFEDFDYGAFRFSWRGIRFPSVSFRPPATVKDFADYLTLATKPMGAGRRLYRVTADASCAGRAIRAYEAKDVEAFALLEKVCFLNGCSFDVKGTNVTIKAELSDAELVPPDLDELLGELTAAGMASVKGADYAAGWFNSAVKGDYDDEREVLPSNGYYYGADWPGRVGNTWTLPVEGNTNLVRFLAYDCVWWEVARGEDVTATRFNVNCFIPADNGTVRLRREIAKLTFALEENPDAVKPARALAFALQLHSAGLRNEAARITELLWRRPKNACEALKEFRAQVADTRGKYPTVEAWRKGSARRQAEKEARKKAEEAKSGDAGGEGKTSKEEEDDDAPF